MIDDDQVMIEDGFSNGYVNHNMVTSSITEGTFYCFSGQIMEPMDAKTCIAYTLLR